MDSCAISIYKYDRNKGILFIFFGIEPGKRVVFYLIRRGTTIGESGIAAVAQW